MKKLFVCYVLALYLPLFAYAENCSVPSLINGMDIKIPCVVVNGEQFSTTLLNYLLSELYWQWNGELTPIICDDNIFTCVQIDENVNLTFPSLDIGETSYIATFDYASDLGQFNWRYRNHTAKQPELSESSLNTLRKYMTDFVDSGQIPGAVLAVSAGKKTVFLEAFGKRNVNEGLEMTTDTLFHIGSTHKALTSFLLAVLVDEGVLNWDTKAQDIYPKFVLSNAKYASQITIRQLLDMTSGLPKGADIVFDAPTRIILEGLGKVELIGGPGEQYEYSNLSVSIAAYLGILAQTKVDNGEIQDNDLNNLHAGYERLLREKVLQPLKMENSYLYINDARATGRMANSHVLSEDEETFLVSESYDEQIDNIAPAGGLKSTASDMLRYMVTETLQGLTPEGTRLVSKENMLIRQTLSPSPTSPNGYGLCLDIKLLKNGINYIGHSGSYDNFNSTIGFFPELQIAFVLLVNGDSDVILDLTDGDSSIQNKIAEILTQN